MTPILITLSSLLTGLLFDFAEDRDWPRERVIIAIIASWLITIMCAICESLL